MDGILGSQVDERRRRRNSNPFCGKEYSVKYALRMPVDLHRDAAIRADEQGASLNQCLLTKISG